MPFPAETGPCRAAPAAAPTNAEHPVRRDRPQARLTAVSLLLGATAVAGLAEAFVAQRPLALVAWLAQAGLLATAIAFAHRRARAARADAERHAHLADELREAIAAAETANRSKSQFLANMSHELRTPFQGVLGMLQLMEQTSLNPLQQDMVLTAQGSARHLLDLLNDVLDVSAIDAGRLVLHEAPVDLRRLCADVHTLMRVQAAERGLRLHVDLSPQVPRWVQGDATRLKQILINLLGNAVKFTPQGHVRLAVHRDPRGAGDLVFEVSDTGAGMDAATLARLFRRFELGDPTRSRKVGGAGLGLEISRSLARMMGGDLTVASQPAAGSTFRLVVRLQPCDAPAEAHAPAQQPAAPDRPLRVLVADDHPVNRKYLALLLASLGHEAILCEDGQQVLDRVRRDDFDAVVMDVHMPVLDGLAATRAIRCLPAGDSDLPVIGLTADTLEATRQAARDAGLTALLTKPVDANALAALLAGIAPRSRWASAAPSGSDWPATMPADALAGGAPSFHDATVPSELSSRFDQLSQALPSHELPGLLDMFFEDRSHTLADLTAALEQRDTHRVAEAAHKLKGSARLLGFRRLAHVAEAIEQSVERRSVESDAPSLATALRDAVASTRSAVGSYGNS